jgi:segregation and condensation protein B
MQPLVPPDRVVADALRRLEQAVEAVVFASDVPLRPEDIRRVVADVTGGDVAPEAVDAAVERLNAAYREGGRAFRIESWGGGYRMATTEELSPYVRALFQQEEEKRMSRSLLETLAVIAYKQPTTKPEVDAIRGVKSDYALRQLLERDFVAVTGRSDSVGRPLLYGTTDRFLDQFGLTGLDALPSPREIEEILDDPKFSRERAQLLAEFAASSPHPEGDPDDEGDEGDKGAADSPHPSGSHLRVVVSSNASPDADDADG